MEAKSRSVRWASKRAGTRTAASFVVLAALFLLVCGCGGRGGGSGTNGGDLPLGVAKVTTNQSPTWYAGTPGNLGVTVLGGITPYSYAWTFSGTADPTPTSATGATPAVTPNAVGTLHVVVIVSDSSPVPRHGQAFGDFTIATPPGMHDPIGAITANISGTWTAGTPGVFSILINGGTQPYHYLWTFSGSSNPTPASSTDASPTVTPTMQGTLHVALHVADSGTPQSSGDATATDFTISWPPPPDDTLYITTDKDTYAEGDIVQITANIQAVANNLNQFDACRIAFTATADRHYLRYSTAPADLNHKFKLGPNWIADPLGVDDGIFNVITKDSTNPRHLDDGIRIQMETGGDESIPALNNQPETVDGIASIYDLRDFSIIWAPSGSPYPEVAPASSGAAFTIEQKVQVGASGHDVHIGFIALDALGTRTYYTNAAGGATKLMFSHLQGKTIHIS